MEEDKSLRKVVHDPFHVAAPFLGRLKSFPQYFLFVSLGKSNTLRHTFWLLQQLSRAGFPLLPALRWQPHVRVMTQCLAEAGRASGGPQPATEQAWLCAGWLKRSFMTALSTA